MQGIFLGWLIRYSASYSRYSNENRSLKQQHDRNTNNNQQQPQIMTKTSTRLSER